MAHECHSKKKKLQKKSLRRRCAINQNAFRFPGARPNMADAWIRNSDWEDDNDTCQLSRLRRESHACGLKTSISRPLTPVDQFLTPD